MVHHFSSYHNGFQRPPRSPSRQCQGSQLKDLDFQPLLSDVGLDAMEKVIKRSQKLTRFNSCFFDLECGLHPEKAVQELTRHREVLTGLTLHGTDSIERWLLRIAKAHHQEQLANAE